MKCGDAQLPDDDMIVSPIRLDSGLWIQKVFQHSTKVIVSTLCSEPSAVGRQTDNVFLHHEASPLWGFLSSKELKIS
eukprot:scaffold119265_cov34-Cyclotella_meneghiniana.AAC.2